MSINHIDISKLDELEKFRSAPKLNKKQSKIIFDELSLTIYRTEWVTIGIMSPSLKKAIHVIRRIEKKFKFKTMKCMTLPSSEGPIFLKANQKTGEIHARNELGLGEGILISCQNYDNSLTTKTIGPFPLDFFD